MTEDEAKELKAGVFIDTVVLGRVMVVGHMNGRSSVDGLELLHPDGSLRYLTYADVALTSDEWTEIQAAWKRMREAKPR